jgi:hypothetical protein
MRRIDLLIQEARRETDNLSFTADSGIQDSEFLRYANSAQTKILSMIQDKNPQVFLEVSTVSSVAQQEAYTLDVDVYMNTRLVMVEYTDSIPNNYRKLRSGMMHERTSGVTGIPNLYIRRDNELLLFPTPNNSAGTIRLTWQRRLPKLDIRRAQVLSVATSGTSITSLFLDPSASVFDYQTIIDEGYMCVCNKDGVISMRGIPVDDIDVTTGEVTVSAGFAFEAGESIAVGAWATSGAYSTTNSELNEICEKYLVDFMIWKVEKRDSSESSQEQNQELQDIAMDIIGSYSAPSADIIYVPMIDSQYFGIDRFIR